MAVHSIVSAEEMQRRAAAFVPELRAAALATERERKVSAEMTEKLRAAGFFKMQQPARYGGFEHGFAVRLASQAVNLLFELSGGAGLALDNPVQRAWRDVNAIARHIGVNWDVVSAMYGQRQFGLEPRGQY